MMEPTSFTAASAEEAVTQIRQTLGPEAVVLNVRRVPPNGLARLWQKPMIEVLAHRPVAAAEPEAPLVEALAEFREQLAEIKQRVGSRQAPVETPAPAAPATKPAKAVAVVDPPERAVEPEASRWRVGPILRKSGLLPLHVQHVLDRLHQQFGEHPPVSLAEEIEFARSVLTDSWKTAEPAAAAGVHVFVGPPGCGKTTYLSKWLTQSVLMEGRTARVWRLDGTIANAAESLSVYGEILGVTVQRTWEPAEAPDQGAMGFVDLPGVDWRKPTAIRDLGEQIKALGGARVHLVLNGAYDVSILLAQYRAFAPLGPDDLTITHLDEETAWGKLWNLVLGTNCSIRHFSSGQNVPGDLCEASPKLVFSRQFPGKPGGNGIANQLAG